jgi:hypothetical protein
MAAGSVVSFRPPVGEFLRVENDRAQGVRVGRFRLAELLDSIFHRFGNISGLPERGCVFTVSSKYGPVSVTTVTRFSDQDHQPHLPRCAAHHTAAASAEERQSTRDGCAIRLNKHQLRQRRHALLPLAEAAGY